MTKNNLKAILFASLIAAMILPFSAMNMADAAPNENTNERDTENKGKLYIKDVRDMKNDIEELNNLHQIVNDETSSFADKNDASKRMNEIKEQFENKGKIAGQKQTEIRGHIDSVGNAIDDLMKKHNIAIVTVGTDFENDSLRIGIDRSGLTDSKIKNVEKQIREIVGDEIDITIEYSDPTYFKACSQTADCNPMQGGVKIQAEGATHCSMGYKATYDSKVGFITAGHCMKNTSVGQKVYNYNNWWQDDLLGSVVKNTLATITSCDCAFVEETEADESISNKVYSNISLSGVKLPQQYGWAYFEGYDTKGSYAGITDNYVIKVIEGKVIIGLVETNGIVDGGDSGGTVYEGFASGTPKFMGIITASLSQSNTPSYYTPYNNIQSNFNGITFG